MSSLRNGVSAIAVFLLGAMCGFHGASALAQTRDQTADLVIIHGRVYSADGSGTFQEAVAIRGNRILRVGSNREIEALRTPQTQVIDAQGAAVVPGFNDIHAHILSG